MKLILPVLFLTAAASVASAGAILNPSVTNLSGDYSSQTGDTTAEFLTSASAPVLDLSGTDPVLRSHLTWYFGQRTAAPRSSGTATADLSYQLSFDVSNTPGNLYALFIDASLAGFGTGQYESGIGSLDWLMSDIEASVLKDGVPLPLAAFTLPGTSGSVSANQTDLNDPVLGFAFSPGDSGDTALHNYMIVISSKLSLSYAAGDSGEAGLRFGLNPTLPALTVSATPDSERADLGLQLSVQLLSFGEPAPEVPNQVPEPATLWTTSALLAGFALKALRRRNQRSRK